MTIRNHYLIDKAPLQGLPQATWNRFARAADTVLDQQGNPAGRRGYPLQRIKNGTTDLRRGECLMIDSAVIDSDDNPSEFDWRPVWLGIPPSVLPGADTVKHRLAVLSSDLAGDDIGICRISGPCQVLVNMTDLGHRFASLQPSTSLYVMQSGETGDYPIIAKGSSQGTGEQLCWVMLGGGAAGSALYQFTLTEDMGATTAGQATGQVAQPGAAQDVTETLKDHPAGIFAILKTGQQGWALKAGADYWIIQANCPPADYEEGGGDGSLSGDGTFVYA